MNYLFLGAVLFFVIYIIWIVKFLERKLPERDKRVQEELKAEIRRHEAKKEYENKQNEEIQKIIKSQNNKKKYKDNIRKGRDYELYIIDYYRKQGYKTKGHGVLEGKQDKGIDVIIMKNKEITLIQCKNWKKESAYKIKHKHLKEFLGNTTAFLDKNRDKAKGFTIKRLYITSNDVLDNSAKHFLKENSILKHKVIPMEI